MGNIMHDPVSPRTTGILDCEFSTIVPAQRWHPQRAFIWDIGEGEGKAAFIDRAMRRCAERGVPIRGYDEVWVQEAGKHAIDY